MQATEWSNVGWQLLRSAGLDTIARLILQSSSMALPQLIAEQITADAAFVDGSHRFHEVFVDLYFLRQIVRPGGIVEPLKALADTIESGRLDPQRASAYASALEQARVGYPDDTSGPGDPALLDVPTLCDNLQKISADPVAGPARALGTIVRSRLVKWHYSRKGHHRGSALYYQPVKPSDADRSHLYDEGTASSDSQHYAQLALSRATGWHRVALHPLR